jgi:ABC-type transport system involved in multi-copper enzyme maturation permease subunit
MGDYDHDYPLFKIYKVYDFTFVIAFILSLLAIFITYDAVTGERESGILRLALSSQVNKSKFLLGKVVGGYLSVILPYLISFITSLLILLLATDINFNMVSYSRLGLALGVSLLYLGVIFLITTLASIFFSRSSTALFSVLVLWVLMAFIVPYLSAQISRKVVPTMQFKDMFLTLTKIQDEENAKARKEFEPHKKSKNRDEISNGIWRRAHGRMEERWVVFLKGYKNRFGNQMQLGIVLARVSPVASFVLAASNLFNTGLHDYRQAEEWKDELEITSKKVFDDEMNRRRKKFAHLEYRKQNEEVSKKQKFDLKLLPSRVYQGISLPGSLLLSLPDGIILLLENILLFLLCFIAFVKRGE